MDNDRTYCLLQNGEVFTFQFNFPVRYSTDEIDEIPKIEYYTDIFSKA